MRLITIALGCLAACSTHEGKDPSPARKADEPFPAVKAEVRELWVFATPESDMESGQGSGPERFCGAEARAKAAELVPPEADRPRCEKLVPDLLRCEMVEGILLKRSFGGALHPWAAIYRGRALTDEAAAKEEERIRGFIDRARKEPCP